jgi:hypothetical protein
MAVVQWYYSKILRLTGTDTASQLLALLLYSFYSQTPEPQEKIPASTQVKYSELSASVPPHCLFH